jgi:hypothetical protein
MQPINEKPSRNEDEYFLKYDAEILKARRAELDAQRAASERTSHFMKCPKDGADLAEREFHHVKVDVCSECGGMWFDKGEVDQLERVAPRGFFNALFGNR